jgi:hypothetical protein
MIAAFALPTFSLSFSGSLRSIAAETLIREASCRGSLASRETANSCAIEIAI